MSGTSPRIRWGVIADARGAQRRRWKGLLTVVLLALILALAGYAAFGGSGGGARAVFAIPPPGRATGALRALSPADYAFWASPDLGAGHAGMDLRVSLGTGGGWSMSGDDQFGRGEVASVLGEADVAAPVPFGQDPDNVLFVAANVAALRVGRFGTAAAASAGGLPTSERVVAFSVPQRPASTSRLPAGTGIAIFGFPGRQAGGTQAHTGAGGRLPQALRNLIPPFEHLVPVTPLDAGGHAIPLARGAAAPVPKLSTAGSGACAVSSTLPGLSPVGGHSVVAIAPLPASVRFPFLSCLDGAFSYAGANLQVALLLNAHRPGRAPAPLWGATPVAWHPGVVELAPPAQFGFDVDTGAPMYARRAGAAWLIVAGRPGVAPIPSDAARIRVLESVRVTRA